MNIFENQKTVGILCHSFKNYGTPSDLDPQKLPYQMLSSGKSLLEQSLSELQRFCEQVYFCVDEELYSDSDLLRELVDAHEVHLIIKPNLSPYTAMEAVSSLINRNDLMVFNQLGWICSYEDSLLNIIANSKTSLGNFCVFGEDYGAVKPDNSWELSRNIKSVSLTYNSEPAFVSSTGKLIRWTGLIISSQKGFLNLSSEMDDSNEHTEFKYEEFNQAVPIAACALDLSIVLGAPAFSTYPFYLSIGGLNLLNFHNSNSEIYGYQRCHK